MSNFDSQKNKKKPSPVKKNVALAKQRWSFIQNDLTMQASEWTLENFNQNIKTPDEEHFDKMKTIICDLKDKLEKF